LADYVQTITNGLRLFGGEYSTKWGQSFGSPYTMVWGTTKWGEGSYTVVLDVRKLISNAITPSLDPYYLTSKLISNLLTPTSDMSRETLSQGDWNYVFPSDTTNIEGLDTPTWAAGSSSSPTWTTGTAGSTTWT